MIDHKQAAALLAVLQWGSFERAAEALHVSPSAISQRIRALEAKLGRTLLTRSQPCTATADGRRLLPFLRHAQWLAQETAAVFEPNRHLCLPLAANYDALDTWLPPVLAQLATEETVLFDISGDDQEHTLRRLAEGEVVAAISSEANSLHGCEAHCLGWQHYRMLATPDFAARYFDGGPNPQRLARAPVLVFNRKDRLHERCLQSWFGLDARACPAHYVPASHAYFQAALAGLGWALLPDAQVEAALAQGRLCDLAPGRRLAVAAYWHCWQTQPPRLARLGRRLQALAADYLAAQPEA